ncbi:MAG: xanthine dehydrogenase family protein molybdopterin-binding subunit [Chloroflexi bacterium]|nr:xanthine dehydrogenase family protein molybdopterin-binding subunit [Chloroflexota bacterium]
MPEQLSIIGKRLPRFGAIDIVTGTARFTQDTYLPGMLHGMVLCSPHAHADIVRIETSQAEALPGVRGVITYKDVEQFPDAISAPGAEPMKVMAKTLYFVGDYVAALVAETSEAAERALELIKVDYRELPPVFDAKESMKPGAPVQNSLWPWNVWNSKERGQPSLVIDKTRLTGGNVEKGFAEADAIVEEEVHTQVGLHAPLETDTVVVAWDASGVCTMWTKENPDSVVDWISPTLSKVYGTPINKLRVICHHAGGRFGKHVDLRILAMATALARKTGRPVRFQNLREWEYHWGRAMTHSLVKMGSKEDGSITAIDMRTVTNFGISHARPATELRNIGRAPNWTWKCPNCRYVNYGVYTNISGTGPFRGFGSTQGHYAISQLCDRLIEKLGMDHIDFYLKNHAGAGDWWEEQKQTPSGLDDCMRRAAEAIGWKEKSHKPGEQTLPDGRKHGMGMAVAAHSGGGSNTPGAAFVEVNKDGSVQLFAAADETGQGIYTIEAAICAEELGVRFEDVRVVRADTESAPAASFSSHSQNTCNMGGAVQLAARDAKKKLLALAAGELGAKPEELDAREGWIYVMADPAKKIEIKAVTAKYIGSRAVVNSKPIGCRIDGYGWYAQWENVPWSPEEPEGSLVPKTWICHMAEVAVDTGTGAVEILKYVIAQDVGRAISLNTAENQLLGSSLMGIGYSLTEDFVRDPRNGQGLNPTYLDYKIPTHLDAPPTTAILVETFNPNTVFGAKGIGEASLVPSAPAISHAVYNAIGVRLNSTPITPDKVLKALGKTK